MKNAMIFGTITVLFWLWANKSDTFKAGVTRLAT